MFKLILVLITFMFNSPQAQAYIMAKLGNTSNPKTHHVIVTGVGNELSTMFLESAMGKAQKIAESEPQSLVVIFANVSTSVEKEKELLSSSGFVVERANERNFGLVFLNDYAKVSPLIDSLHILSHSAIGYGIHLYKGGRYSATNSLWASLKGRFTAQAYVDLAGCNTGFYLAPQLADTLGVPAVGALTSTEFHYLDAKGTWRYAAPISDLKGPRVATNTISYDSPKSCRAGACIRMMPLFRSYSGYWGDYQNGSFPAFKFFCGNTPKDSCSKIMVRSLYHSLLDVSISEKSTVEEKRRAVQTYLCPRFNNDQKQADCIQQLQNISLNSQPSTYSPALDYTIRCNHQRCDFAFECKKEGIFVRETKCTLKPSSAPSYSFVDEYKMYLRGL
ncbi:MAG: hypothetical protein ACLGGX_05085 [Bdellovibrionia bacterium]